MVKINKSELSKKHGIDLDRGLYNIEISNGYYNIYKVRDDTAGCLLPGVNDVKGKVSQSTKYFTLIFDKISNAINVKHEKVFINII